MHWQCQFDTVHGDLEMSEIQFEPLKTLIVRNPFCNQMYRVDSIDCVTWSHSKYLSDTIRLNLIIAYLLSPSKSLYRLTYISTNEQHWNFLSQIGIIFWWTEIRQRNSALPRGDLAGKSVSSSRWENHLKWLNSVVGSSHWEILSLDFRPLFSIRENTIETD